MSIISQFNIYIYIYTFSSVKGVDVVGGSGRRDTEVHIRGIINSFQFNNQVLLRTDE